jgi:hypothetical protein
MADIAFSDSESRAEVVFPQLALLIITGGAALGVIIIVVLFWMALPWWALPVAMFAGGLAGAAWGGAHIVSRLEWERDEQLALKRDELDIKRRELWAKERSSGRSDQDGAIGEPPPAAYRAPGGTIIYEPAPAAEDRRAFREFVTVAWNQHVTSRRDWHRRGMEYATWALYTERLRRAGVARRKDLRPWSGLRTLVTLDNALAVLAEFT